jgi:hypothetical protein
MVATGGQGSEAVAGVPPTRLSKWTVAFSHELRTYCNCINGEINVAPRIAAQIAGIKSVAKDGFRT